MSPQWLILSLLACVLVITVILTARKAWKLWKIGMTSVPIDRESWDSRSHFLSLSLSSLSFAIEQAESKEEGQISMERKQARRALSNSQLNLQALEVGIPSQSNARLICAPVASISSCMPVPVQY
jgi:hypothetical protein